MSRGLGKVQRAILEAYGALCATGRGGTLASPAGVIEARQLRHAVPKAWAARGEPVGYGFNDSRSRALRSLISAGLLVAVEEGGGPPPPFFYTNVRFVSRLTDT